MRTPIIILASLLAQSSAHAERVGIVVTGEPTVQPQVAAQLEVWLRDHGRTVVSGPLDPESISTLIDCFVLEDLGCARGLVEARSKANSLVFTRVEVTANSSDGTRDVAITGHWFKKQHDAVIERRVCTNCNDQALHATVDELMLSLVHEPPPALPNLAAPPAAEPAPEPAPTPAEQSPLRFLPHALIGVGALALISGGIMIAIDQDADPSGVQEPAYRDTATGGVVVGLVGAAAIGTGVYLWLRAHPGSQPVASVSPSGGFVGWAGRF